MFKPGELIKIVIVHKDPLYLLVRIFGKDVYEDLSKRRKTLYPNLDRTSFYFPDFFIVTKEYLGDKERWVEVYSGRYFRFFNLPARFAKRIKS